MWVLRRDDKVELLKGIPLFAQCSKKDLRRHRPAHGGGRLRSRGNADGEGERGSEVFVVVVDADSRSHAVAKGTSPRSVPARWWAKIALLSNQPRSATGRTAGDLCPPMADWWCRVSRPVRADAAPWAEDHASAGRPHRERRAPTAALRGLTRRAAGSTRRRGPLPSQRAAGQARAAAVGRIRRGDRARRR